MNIIKKETFTIFRYGRKSSIAHSIAKHTHRRNQKSKGSTRGMLPLPFSKDREGSLRTWQGKLNQQLIYQVQIKCILDLFLI